MILNPNGYVLTSCGFDAFIHTFEVCSIDSSKTTSNSPEVSNFDRLFLELHRFICNQLPVLPGLRLGGSIDVFGSTKGPDIFFKSRILVAAFLKFHAFKRGVWHLFNGPQKLTIKEHMSLVQCTTRIKWLIHMPKTAFMLYFTSRLQTIFYQNVIQKFQKFLFYKTCIGNKHPHTHTTKL